jgi:hypothetical protein
MQTINSEYEEDPVKWIVIESEALKKEEEIERRLKWIDNVLQYMNSSLAEWKDVRTKTGYHNDMLCSCQRSEVEHMNRWKRVFEPDNKFCFNEKMWKEMLKLKPTILALDEWITIEKVKK